MKQSTAIGTETSSIIKVVICASCKCAIEMDLMCEYDCKDDGLPLNERSHIIAKYQRTDRLIAWQEVEVV